MSFHQPTQQKSKIIIPNMAAWKNYKYYEFIISYLKSKTSHDKRFKEDDSNGKLLFIHDDKSFSLEPFISFVLYKIYIIDKIINSNGCELSECDYYWQLAQNSYKIFINFNLSISLGRNSHFHEKIMNVLKTKYKKQIGHIYNKICIKNTQNQWLPLEQMLNYINCFLEESKSILL